MKKSRENKGIITNHHPSTKHKLFVGSKNATAGITLIALVITVIVLLILAGVTIATLTVDNGILTQAGKAKETAEIGEEKEIIGLSVIQVTNNNGTIDEDELQKALNENSKEGNKASIIASDIETFNVKFESNRYYEVNKGGSIEYIENATGEKILTVQCVNSKNELLKEYRYTIVTDDYSKAPPIVEGYEAQNERIIGKITEDTTIKILYYYLIQEDDLVFTGLNKGGNITTNEDDIVTYMIGTNSSINGNAMKRKLTCDSILITPTLYQSKPVTHIGISAFNGDSSSVGTYIKYVTITDSIKSINGWAFAWCRNMIMCTIGSGVTNIGSKAFIGDSALKKIIYNNETTAIVSNEEIFRDCNSWKEVEINGSNKKFKVIDNVLYDTENNLIRIPTGYTGEFTLNDDIQSIERNAVEYCTGITKFDISNSVKTIKFTAFSKCRELKTVIIGSGVENIESWAFGNCLNLSKVVIGENIKSIGNAAFQNTSLHEVIIKSKTVTKNITDASSYGKLVNDGVKIIYIQKDIKAEDINAYITNNYILSDISDIDEYNKYEKISD